MKPEDFPVGKAETSTQTSHCQPFLNDNFEDDSMTWSPEAYHGRIDDPSTYETNLVIAHNIAEQLTNFDDVFLPKETQMDLKDESDEIGPLSPKNTPTGSSSDCYENKEYTDTVNSQSSTRPLLNLKEEHIIPRFAKDIDLPMPVVIDHPSFMSSHHDLSSTTNISFACQKALMYLQDERVASSLRLSGSCKDLTNKGLEEKGELDHNILPSGHHMRSLIALSICLTMVFSSCGALRNLQTSVNPEDGIGIKCQLMSFVGFILGSLVSPFVVQKLCPHRSLLCSLVVHFVYIVVHFYPSLWLVLPVSLMLGLASAVLWNAMSTYVTFLAKGSSEKKGKGYENTLSRYFGTFYLVLQLNMIIGNLTASLIFTYVKPLDVEANSTQVFNSTLENLTNLGSLNESHLIYDSESPLNASQCFCGPDFCHHYAADEGPTASLTAKYVLYGVYMGFMIVAFLINIFLLEPLNANLFSSNLTVRVIKSQFVSFGRILKNRKFLLLCPFLLYSFMEYAFLSGEIAMAFVTCPLGVHMAGYALICVGVSGSISSYLSGTLCRILGRKILIGIAVATNLGLITFMSIWRPSGDSLIIVFSIVTLWGMADGIWVTQSNSVIGVMFPDQFEEAFAGCRIVQGLGPALGFAYAESLCMAVKLYILGGICVFALIGYLMAERVFQAEQSISEVTYPRTAKS